MNKILYIYGYGSNCTSQTALSIKAIFKEDEVYCIDYPQHDIKKSIEILQDFIRKNDINIVIASSYGAFVSLFLNNVIKILYNPCMKPSYELPKIGVTDKTFLDECKQYEDKMDKIPFENTVLTYGMFSTNDELLGNKYYNMFKQFGTPIDVPTCGHRVNYVTLEILKDWLSIIIDDIKKEWHKL